MVETGDLASLAMHAPHLAGFGSRSAPCLELLPAGSSKNGQPVVDMVAVHAHEPQKPIISAGGAGVEGVP